MKEKQYSNPFRAITYISPAKEMLKISFTRAKKPQIGRIPKKYTREQKIALVEKKRVEVLGSELRSRLLKLVKQYPSIDEIHPFYQEICNLSGDTEKIKMSLGRLSGIVKQMSLIEREILRELGKSKHPQEMEKLRRAAGGRFSSLLKAAKNDIKFLDRIAKKMRKIPDFDVRFPTIVIAGAPNVGKSSLVRRISTGTPEIGEYPFTTKQIIFGHRDIFFTKAQVVDTPGILDRPFDERNIIEKHSITTIKHISDIIVFMFDTTKDAELSLEEQMNLAEDIKKEFKDIILIRVLNKIDLLEEKEISLLKMKLNTDYELSTMREETLVAFKKVLDELLIKLVKSNKKFESEYKIEIAKEYEEVEEDLDNYDYEL